MIITPHALTGAALATTTNNYAVAFFLGFLSHFVLDALPHFDPGTFHKFKNPITHQEVELGKVSNSPAKPWPLWIYLFAGTEFILFIIVFYFLFRGRLDFYILAIGALGGISVDILDNNITDFLRKLPIFKQIHQVHEIVHTELPIKYWYWGVISQLAIIGGSLWLLLKY